MPPRQNIYHPTPKQEIVDGLRREINPKPWIKKDHVTGQYVVFLPHDVRVVCVWCFKVRNMHMILFYNWWLTTGSAHCCQEHAQNSISSHIRKECPNHPERPEQKSAALLQSGDQAELLKLLSNLTRVMGAGNITRPDKRTRENVPTESPEFSDSDCEKLGQERKIPSVAPAVAAFAKKRKPNELTGKPWIKRNLGAAALKENAELKKRIARLEAGLKDEKKPPANIGKSTSNWM